MYILLTSKPPTERPRAIDPEPDQTLASPKRKPKNHPHVDLDVDIDVYADSDSGPDAIVTRKKADKGKAKAIDQPEGDLNGGPTARVCYSRLSLNVCPSKCIFL